MEGIRLEDLLGIDRQKRAVEENTRQFLAGYPANNVLLWGTRGTGKSSLIRACLHAFSSRGLRLVEVDKRDLIDLDVRPEILKGQFWADVEMENPPMRYLGLERIRE